MQIILQPVSFDPYEDIIFLLDTHISEEFDISVANIASPSIKELPLLLFDRYRNQWKSSNILQWLWDKHKPDKLTKILAICDLDAYSDGLNFVFGEAYVNGSVSAIYLPRLRQEFYGLKADELLFQQRIIKEAVHELGHAFGIRHCENKICVMHFSNSLADTDFKAKNFCKRCKTLSKSASIL
jgi:archaemetzincin